MGSDDGVSYTMKNSKVICMEKLTFTLCIVETNKCFVIFRRYSRTYKNRASADRSIWNTMGQIAQRAPDRHLYTFVTSQKGGFGFLGWANMRALCGGRSRRVGISRYSKGKTTYTAEVCVLVPLTISKLEFITNSFFL